MKKILMIITLVLSLHIVATAQSLIESFISSVEEGSANNMDTLFDNYVEFTLENTTVTYSKTQAAMVLGDFFEKNRIKKCSLTNKGISGSNTYYIGHLDSSVSNYLIFLYTKRKDNTEKIIEIRLRKLK